MEKNEKYGLSGTELIIKALFCSALGLLVTMLLIFGFSILMSTGAGLLQLESQYIIVSVIIGSIIAGNKCTKNISRGVVTAGFLAGVCYALLLLIVAIIIPKGDYENSILLKNIIAAVCGASFGGTLRLYKKNKKSKLRRR